MENNYIIPIKYTMTNLLEIRSQEAKEILRIDPNGRIFWKQREIETDDEFRSAMLELRDALMTRMR
jgi:hypothetical protein